MRQDVEFPGSGGVTLRGDLYLPDACGTSSPVPGVVMNHGFSATRRMALPAFAEALCAAGIAVLLYDHRCLGASDGEPRGRINPFAQVRDCRYALDQLAARPEVDARWLGLWGTSYSGGQALLVGAVDERVRAVVANVPFAGLPNVDYTDQADVTRRFEEMRRAVDQTTGRGGPADADVPVWGPAPVVDPLPGESGDARPFMSGVEPARWFHTVGSGTGWTNEFTLAPAGDGPTFDPGVCGPFLGRTAVLMVVGTRDAVAATSSALDSFERLAGPRELVMVEGGHFDSYDGPGLEQAVTASTDFLVRHLGAALPR